MNKQKKGLNRIFFCGILIIFAFAGCQHKSSVSQVEMLNNVPVLFSDGHKLARLMFAGAATGQPVKVGKQWTVIDYSGVCAVDDNDVFIQINLGSGKGEINIESIQLTESEPGQKTPRRLMLKTKFNAGSSWSKDWKVLDFKKVGVAHQIKQDSLSISIPKRLDFPWDVQIASRHLKMKAGKEYNIKIVLKASNNGWPVTSYLMRMNPLHFYASSGRNMFLGTSKLAAKTGVSVISTHLNFPWNEEFKESDFKVVSAYMDKIIETTPDAKLLLRFGVEPPNWWRKKHPEDMLTWENGKTGRYVCVASEKWRRDAQIHVKRIVEFLEENWGKHIIGYLPCAQSTAEWYYPIWINRKCGAMNFSVAFIKGYRKYLKKKYGTITNLNKVWKSFFKSFADIKVPSGKERKKAELGIFRNPVTQKNLIDFAEYQQIAMCEALDLMCRTIKKASNNKKLVFAFYGYIFELSGLKDGIAATGHLGLGWMLKHSDLDVFVDLVSYSDRGSSGTGCLMTPVESILAHKKLLCTEDDSRTYLSAEDAGFERLSNLKETEWALGRNLARSLIHNGYSWKFDLYGKGWLHNKPLWEKLKGIENAFHKTHTPIKPFSSDIAIVVDEKSLLYVKPGTELTKSLLYEMRYAINRMGTASPSWWLLEDVINDIVPAHKVTIFLNAFYLTAEERRKICKYFERHGGTAVWLFAPGYLTPSGPSLKAMQELTGFNFSKISNNENKVLLSGDKNWLAVNMGRKKLNSFFGFPPIFGTDSGKNILTLATFVNAKKGAIAEIQREGYKSIFISSSKLTSEILSAIAVKAGVHAYAPPGNIIVSDGRLLAVTGQKSEDITITLPYNSVVRNIYTNSMPYEKIKKFTDKYMKGETKFYIINKK